MYEFGTEPPNISDLWLNPVFYKKDILSQNIAYKFLSHLKLAPANRFQASLSRDGILQYKAVV